MRAWPFLGLVVALVWAASAPTRWLAFARLEESEPTRSRSCSRPIGYLRHIFSLCQVLEHLQTFPVLLMHDRMVLEGIDMLG